MRRGLCFEIVAFLMVLAHLPVWAEGHENGCTENWNRWHQAFAALKEYAAELRLLKGESITHTIEQALQEKKGRLSMARIVQSVLKDRREKIRSTVEKVSEASHREAAAYSELQRCMGPRDFRKASRSDPDLIERKRLVKDLPDLLLDEAYAQYSRYRGRVHTIRNASVAYVYHPTRENLPPRIGSGLLQPGAASQAP